jgi:predicted membrane-bound spermidine synthase
MNTLGAVVGTIVAGFVLLPNLGLFRTTLCGVAVNVAVFGVAVWLTRLGRSPRVERPSTLNPQPATPNSTQHAAPITDHSLLTWHRGAGLLLPMMLISGFVSFTYEVLWSRLLGHVIGGSTHAFATMLATFLTGITLGSAIASPLARSKHAGLIGFIVAQIGTAISAMGLFWFLEAGIEWLAGTGDKSQLNPVWNAITCSLVLLPSTICIGMTFPFAVRAITDAPGSAGRITGRVYAWNTIGGVLGAVVAGFLLVPELAFTGTIHLAVAVNLTLAALCLLMLPMRPPLKFGAVAAAAMVAMTYRPATPHTLLRSSAMGDAYPDDLVYLGIGRSSTVRIGQSSLFYILTNNGLPEALIAPKGAPTLGLQLHQWLTALPLLARPHAESMLVIGFGSGGAVEIIPESVEEVDVIELEPLVIEANRRCSKLRRFDPLADERINVVINDARGALSLTSKRYDVVVSQPSHPWTAGASHLYTREFMELVRDHLTEDGVFLQWMNTSFVDDDLFKALGSTLLSVFPNVRLYQPQPRVMFFLASTGELDLERQLLQTGEPLRSAPEAYRLTGINGVNSLIPALLLDEEGMRQACAGASPNTDDRNRLAFAASHNRSTIASSDLTRLLRQWDPLLNHDSTLYVPPDLPINPAVIAARLHFCSFDERAAEYSQSCESFGERSLTDGVIQRANNEKEAAQAAFLAALAENPDDVEAAYQLCEMNVRALAKGGADAAVEDVLTCLPEPQATVMKAAIALHRDEFKTIRALDAALSRISPETSAFGMAVNCRCAWRAAGSNTPERLRLALEAIELADQAIAISPRTQTFLMRFNAVTMVSDLEGVMETALHLGMKLIQFDQATADDFLYEGQGAAVIVPKLERLKYDRRVDPGRLSFVRAVFDEMMMSADGLPNDVTRPALQY